MVYDEFRARVKALEWSLVRVAEDFGIGVQTVYQWKTHGVPRYAEYWLLWRESGGERNEAVEQVGKIREILGWS